ncbi:MAG: ABC transporter substrate-binding protein [Paenibacillaceae bacterium]
MKMQMSKFTKWASLLLVILMFAVVIAGCGTNAPEATEPNEQGGEINTPSEKPAVDEPKAEEPEIQISRSGAGEYGWLSNTEGQFPITVMDGTGQEVTIEKLPQSIVSLQASHTEISFALGLGDQIVGVSDYCNYPEEALTKDKVGAQDMDVEKILSMMPDLALVTDYHYKSHAGVLDQLKEAGIKVIVINGPTSFDQTYTTIQLIGGVTGTIVKADQIVLDMQQRLAQVIKKAEQVTDVANVWVEVSPAPDIYTTGSGTFMHEMLEAIGATNAAGHLVGWNKLTEEEIVILMPDVIVTTYGYYVDKPEEGVYSRAGWAEVPAIKNKRVYDVDSDTVTRPGPRLIDGVELLGQIIYPDVFK